MTYAFRWEERCLSDDPFAGDFGDGSNITLSDKMVTNRKGGTCHNCAGECVPGTRNRVIVESDEDGISSYRFCQACCFAMAVYNIRPSIGDRLNELGDQRRAAARGSKPLVETACGLDAKHESRAEGLAQTQPGPSS